MVQDYLLLPLVPELPVNLELQKFLLGLWHPEHQDDLYHPVHPRYLCLHQHLEHQDDQSLLSVLVVPWVLCYPEHQGYLFLRLDLVNLLHLLLLEHLDVLFDPEHLWHQQNLLLPEHQDVLYYLWDPLVLKHLEHLVLQDVPQHLENLVVLWHLVVLEGQGYL